MKLVCVVRNHFVYGRVCFVVVDLALKMGGLIRIVVGVCADLVGVSRSEGVSAGAVHDNMPSLSLLSV